MAPAVTRDVEPSATGVEDHPTALGGCTPPCLVIRANQDNDYVHGGTSPGATVWVTLTDHLGAVKGAFTRTAEPSGFWDADFGKYLGQDIVPGDVVLASSSDGSARSATVLPMSAAVNAETGIVSGQIVGGVFPARVAAEAGDKESFRRVEGMTDASGRYSLSFAGFPLRRDWGVTVWYSEPDGDEIGITRSGFALQVCYGQDWVETRYEAGYTIWITVTDGLGMVKATATGTTGPVSIWGGQNGFSTIVSGWSPAEPDIVPGDWVYAALSNRLTSSVRVGTITGALDIASDTVSGNISAPWFTQTLRVSCEIWEEDAPKTGEISADPNGGAYLYDFGADGWDLQPGQTVAVRYSEPDGDQVINVFREGVPNLWVQKQLEGQGNVAPGGPVLFRISYQNYGDGAGATVLTDTLPSHTTYVTDSSGFPAHVSGNRVTWNLGSVPPGGVPRTFYLLLANSASAGTTLHNQVDIAAAWEQDWSKNHAEADATVTAGQPDLYVNQSASPGDPAPGQLFSYNVYYGNQGPVASGAAWLTDTLPASTTLVSWQSANGYGLWSAVSTAGGRLVLRAPAVPAGFGDCILVTLRLASDVPSGASLVNDVRIATAGDSNPGNNHSTESSAHPGQPRFDTYLNPEWAAGGLNPGNWLEYNLHFGNGGNSVMPGVVLTQTVPAATAFVRAIMSYDSPEQWPLAPTRQVGNQLVWELGDLAVSQHGTLRVRLRINPDTAPGTVLAGCATLSGGALEDNPYNNYGCVVETVQPAGPNLRVSKRVMKQWDGGISYQARVENVGTTVLENVIVTDTLPASSTFAKWEVRDTGWSGGVSGNRLLLTLPRLEPCQWATIDLDLDQPPLPYGTIFTNTLEAGAVPGEVNTADNRAYAVAGIGPDLSVLKLLTGGRLKAGQLLTYTLHCENHSLAWATQGAIWVTDTLPVGLEFVASYERLCKDGYFCERPPDRHIGQQLAWQLGNWGPVNWNDIIVVARAAATVRGGTLLTNAATIASDSPADVEPDYRDNASTVATRSGAMLHLPLVGRQWR